MEESLSKEIFEKTEDSIYNLLGQHMEFNGLEQTMVYMHMRAYFIVLAKLYIKKFDKKNEFEKVFANYKFTILTYYKQNNPGIPDILMNDLMQSFDVSFQLIESIQLDDVLDNNLLKKFTRDVLESLHAIIERRSKRVISTNFYKNEDIFVDAAKGIKELIRNSL